MASNSKAAQAIAETVVIGLVGLSMLSACGSQQTEGQGESAALVDTGPNAQLGNKELLTIALSNTNALDSFHVAFTERPQDVHWNSALRAYEDNTTTEVSSTMTITADIQDLSKGSLFKVTFGAEELGPDEEAATIGMLGGGMLGGGMPGTEKQPLDLLVKETGLYASTDGGTRWMEQGPGSAGFILLPVLLYTLPFGGRPFDAIIGGIGGMNAFGELSKDLEFEDGDPRLENIDGTIARHLVATLEKPTPDPAGDPSASASWWLERVESINLWISTDAEPKVLKMSAVADSKSSDLPGMDADWPDQVRYALDWKLSRFNEDLGTIEAPSGDAIIKTSP